MSTVLIPTSAAFTVLNGDYRAITEFNAADANGASSVTFNVRVAGHWGTSITLRAERHFFTKEGNWTVKLDHSSGGRLTALSQHYRAEDGYVALPSDLDAEECFGRALIAAAALGRELRLIVGALEAGFRAKAEAAAAKVEADAPVGAEVAARVIAEATAAAKDAVRHAPVTVALFERGSDARRDLTVSTNVAGAVMFHRNCSKITRADALNLIAAASARSALLAAQAA